MMTIDQILTKLDHYYKEDQLTEVEPFLLSCLEDAKKEQEYGIYISVGNELLGFYRSIGQFEAAFAVGEDVLLLMEELQLDHTVHFATNRLRTVRQENTRKHLQIIGVPLKFIKKSFPKTTIVWQSYIAASVFYWKSSTKMKMRRCFWKKRFRLWKNSLEQGLKWRLPGRVLH